jgi:hypothetical protein
MKRILLVSMLLVGCHREPIASNAQALTDGGATSDPLAFPAQINAALCTALAACCDAQDAGPFNVSFCEDQVFTNVHGYRNFYVGLEAWDAGNIIYDQTQASQCLADLYAIEWCSPVAGTSAATMQTDCLLAYQGTLASGASGCTYSIECPIGTYCERDGGTCSPLKAIGDPCPHGDESADAGNIDLYLYGLAQCSWRESNFPPHYCDKVLGCQPAHANGYVCDRHTSPTQCQTTICNNADICGDTTVVTNPGMCAHYRR